MWFVMGGPMYLRKHPTNGWEWVRNRAYAHVFDSERAAQRQTEGRGYSDGAWEAARVVSATHDLDAAGASAGMPTPKRTPEPGRSRSGPTQTDAERRASGRVLVRAWLTAEEHAALESLREGRGVRDTLGSLLVIAARDRRERLESRRRDDDRYAAAMAKRWGPESNEP